MFDHCFVIVEISIPIVKTAVFKYFTQKSSAHSVDLIPLTPLDLLDLLYYLFSTEDALRRPITYNNYPSTYSIAINVFFFNPFA